jgi:glycosyltransferase involved in cell wall biosynthesis
MQSLREHGHRPVAISPHDKYIERLIAEGFDFIDLPLDASGINPLRELRTLHRLRRLLEHACIDAAFTYTPKANIYFGLAAKGLGIHHVPNVSGLGRVFIARSWLTPLVTKLYALAFKSSRAVIFQNDDDHREFVRLSVVSPARTVRVPGSGVDLSKFQPTPTMPRPGGACVFLFIGRILRDKGIVEFIEAARQVRSIHAATRFQVLGSVGAPNPTAVSMAEVEGWVTSGLIEYLGSTDDVRPAIAAADCVVLPSYREGVPRVLLEAAAMGRPSITTDAPGCRDAVDAGVTGLMCPVRDVDALAACMLAFVAQPAEVRVEMGRMARAKMERQFDENIVLGTYVQLASSIQTDLGQRHR